MAPKKKKQNKKDDWDDDNDVIVDLNLNVDEEGQDLGGLMSQLNRNKKKKKKAVDSYDAPEEVQEVAEEPDLPAESLKPEKTEKAEKKKDEEDGGEIRIKSKKEKERERKERAKQASKKTAPKKVALVVEEVEEEESKPDASQKDQKKSKKGGAIAALREQMLLRKQMEEEQERLAREEKERIEREEREEKERQAELLRQKEEKKERERQKIEELKKQGLYLTPAQKKEQARQKAKLEALLASGVIVPGLNADGQPEKKKKVVYSNKKKKPPVKKVEVAEVPESWEDADDKATSTITHAPSDTAKDTWEEEAEEATPAEGLETIEDVRDAWDQEEEPAKDSWDQEKEVKDSWDQEEEVKDSWDQDDDVKDSWEEEEAPEPVKAVKKAEPKAAAKPASKAVAKSEPEVEQKKQAVANMPEPKTEVKKAPAAKETEPEPVEDDGEDEEAYNDEESEEDDDEEDSEDDDDEDDSDEDMTVAEKQALQRKEEARKRREARIAEAYASRTAADLRSPICCILGHVDTGKTKLLDKIRQTNVQEGEAGGITQQIGATYFPISAIEEKTKLIHKGEPSGYNLPGLLVIDTPGHESFTNLRSRGSSLCNIAVLVVDIVHGLEPQTIESLNLLRMRKTPFVVALNKIDRLFDWETHKDFPTRDTLALQKPSVISEFEDRVKKTILEFAEQGLNACLYWENKNMGKYVSLIPTSAVTGEGVPDLLHLLMDLTQTRMTERLMYLSELECTVLEVKVIEGLGTTIDVVLSNGVLNEGDKICVCGLNGPIITQVRALLTPQPMRELRLKSQYQHHKSVKASLGIKIAAPDLEKAIAGSKLMVIGPDDDEDDIMEEVMGDLTSLLSSIDKSGKGVCVQASTLGSLEALLTFLKQMNIPVSGINIGPVHKKDIIRASIMLERAPMYAQLLAFDVPIDKDAEQMAKEMGVTVFTANIIYHLFDKFTAHMKQLEEQRQRDALPSAIFPCVLRMVRDAVFNKRAPIIIGVDVVEGVLKIGTPLCVIGENGAPFSIGKVVGIEQNHKKVQQVKKGDPSSAIRVECAPYQTTAMYGRHFTHDNDIYSQITRASIDVMKTNFRNDLSRDDWALIVRLKKILKVE